MVVVALMLSACVPMPPQGQPVSTGGEESENAPKASGSADPTGSESDPDQAGSKKGSKKKGPSGSASSAKASKCEPISSLLPQVGVYCGEDPNCKPEDHSSVKEIADLDGDGVKDVEVSYLMDRFHNHTVIYTVVPGPECYREVYAGTGDGLVALDTKTNGMVDLDLNVVLRNPMETGSVKLTFDGKKYRWTDVLSCTVPDKKPVGCPWSVFYYDPDGKEAGEAKAKAIMKAAFEKAGEECEAAGAEACSKMCGKDTSSYHCIVMSVYYMSGWRPGIKDGDPSKPNYKLARQTAQTACVAGNEFGCGQVTNLDGKSRNCSNVTDCGRFCDDGFPEGCSRAGLMHRDGDGTAQNQGLALAAFQKGCKLGDKLSCRVIKAEADMPGLFAKCEANRAKVKVLKANKDYKGMKAFDAQWSGTLNELHDAIELTTGNQGPRYKSLILQVRARCSL